MSHHRCAPVSCNTSSNVNARPARSAARALGRRGKRGDAGSHRRPGVGRLRERRRLRVAPRAARDSHERARLAVMGGPVGRETPDVVVEPRVLRRRHDLAASALGRDQHPAPRALNAIERQRLRRQTPRRTGRSPTTTPASARWPDIGSS